jgi:hypothetical protein
MKRDEFDRLRDQMNPQHLNNLLLFEIAKQLEIMNKRGDLDKGETAKDNIPVYHSSPVKKLKPYRDGIYYNHVFIPCPIRYGINIGPVCKHCGLLKITAENTGQSCLPPGGEDEA